jgi:regulator of sirC expression with transglutaminase-like and TPR domain
VDVATIALIEDDDILLDVASLALSHPYHEYTEIARYLEMLEEIENRVRHKRRSSFLPGERAAARSRVLHGDLRFVGDAESYDAPADADFIRALGHQRGLPIALSILYVATA